MLPQSPYICAMCPRAVAKAGAVQGGARGHVVLTLASRGSYALITISHVRDPAQAVVARKLHMSAAGRGRVDHSTVCGLVAALLSSYA